jgi:TRAP-type C4-dicarboxylate transport system permease large subunit
MYATCTIAQTRLQDVVRPYFRYVVVLLVTLALLIMWPALTLWLPKHYGLG